MDYQARLKQLRQKLSLLSCEALLIDHAIPSFMKETDIQHMLALMVQDLVETESSRRLQIKKEEQLALTACRLSMPSAKRLSTD